MSRYLKQFCAAVLGMFLVVVGTKLTSLPLSAEEATNWLSGGLSLQIEESVTGEEAQKSVPFAIDGGHCWEYEFNQKSTKGGSVTYPKAKVGCAVNTASGVAAGDYFHEYGEEYAGQISHTGGTVYHPVPGSSTLVSIRNSGSNKYMRLYPDFANQAETINQNGLEMTYILMNNHTTVADEAGNLIQVSSSPPSSSKNGRWVMAYQSNRYSVRVDLNSGGSSPLLFGGEASGPLRQAITNDGRFALVYYLNSKKTFLFDLSTCQPDPNSVAEQCNSVEISAFLNQHLGNLQNILRLEFIDENHLVIYALHTNSSGVTARSKVQLAPSGAQMLKLDGGYIAMGDSFASGEGDMDSSYYEFGTNEPENKCHLSRRSYPYLISQTLGIDEFHSVACSGATTYWVTDERQNTKEPKINSLGIWIPGNKPQLNYGIENYAVISLSIGGNNIGFAPKLTECVLWGGTCKYAEPGEHRSNVAKEIASMGRNLKSTYQQIINKTQGKTKLYVIGYPQFIKPEGGSCGANVKLNDSERRFIYEAVKYINQVTEAAATSAGAYYVDIEDSLKGKNLCSQVEDGSMAVNGLTFGDDREIPWWVGLGVGGAPGMITVQNIGIANESYHPNQNGHQLMRGSILTSTDGNPITFPVCADDTSVCPSEDIMVPTPDIAYWGSEAHTFALGINLTDRMAVNPIPTHKPMAVVDSSAGSKPRVVVEHLKPGSEVTIEIHSDPTHIGTFVAKADGTVDIPIDMPPNIVSGFHTLRVSGFNTTGEPVEYYEHIFIPGPAGDLDANGVPDDEQQCGFVEDSGQDLDQDGIDDSCDSYIAAAPKIEDGGSEETPVHATLNNQRPPVTTGSTVIAVRNHQIPGGGLAVVDTITSSDSPIIMVAGEQDKKVIETKVEDLVTNNQTKDFSSQYIFEIGATSVILAGGLLYAMRRRYSTN